MWYLNFFSRLSFVAALLFVTIQAIAQNSVNGVVKDESGEVLIGANVIVQGSEDGTITNYDGSYSISTSTAFPFNLEVSFTGYITKEIYVSGPVTDLEIVLLEGLILLGEDVLISASRKREKVQEAPASVSVLTARKLEASPNPTDATRNLINSPGVQIQQQSANRINISMRGGAGLFGTSVFPIVDYKSLVGPGIGTFQTDQAGISTIDLARIEVVRGPGSALYGPGVTQGVVHFITKNPMDYPGTTIELIGGELSTLGIGVRHARKNTDGTFAYKININHKRGDEFVLDINDPEDALQIAKFQNSIVQPGISPEGFVDPTLPPVVLIPGLDDDGDGNPMADNWYNTSFNTTLEFRPKDFLNVVFTGGMTQASSVFYNEQGEGLAQAREYWGQARVQTRGFFAQFFFVDNDGGTMDHPSFLYQTGNRTPVARTQLETQLQYHFETPGFLNANWTAGFDWRFAGQDTENLVYGRNEADDDFSVVGGYAQGKFEISDKLDFVAAVRYDQFNFIDDGALAPRAAFVYKASRNHTFRTSYNRASNTVSNLQLNIDFPLSTVIPGSFDVWLFGNKNVQTFADAPTIDWFSEAIPSLPVGTPGLPHEVILEQEAAPGVTLNQLVIAQLSASLADDPATAAFASIVENVLRGINLATLGHGGQISSGFNIFDGSPLGLIDAPISRIATLDSWELGYKGLFWNKLDVTFDIYYSNQNKNSQFTAISPGYLLLGIERIPAELGAAVQGASQSQIEQALIDTGVPLSVAAATAAGLGAGMNDVYTQAGNLALNTGSPAFGGASLTQVFEALPFHATTQTQQVPDNGTTHLAAGYRTFGSRSYWGSDLGLEYSVNNDLAIFGNYSWVSKTEFFQDVLDTAEEEEIQTNLNIPKNKFRLGFTYTPASGFRGNLAFQHDDSYFSNSGQFSGMTEERNLVDAGVGYKFEQGLSIDLSATNVFDNEYRYLPNFPKIGRRLLARLTYTFGTQK